MKPRDGMGSIDVSIIRNLSELNLWVMHHYKSNILIEKYIAGEMYHVDGIIINNSIEFICVSRYIGTCLGSTKNEGLGSVVLNEDDSSHKALVSITKNLFQLISKPCNMTFHVEFFRKDQDFILCEAASRTGGAYVTRLINEKYGCNLDEWFVCAELGIPYIKGDKRKEIYAAMIVPPLKKRLISYPLEIPYSFCVYYERRGNEGQDYSNYGTCVGRYASFIVKGKTYDDVKLKIKEVKDYVERNTKWE